MRTLRLQLAYPLAFTLLTFSLGCGGDPGPLTSVSGRVTYKGMPVNSGTIVFVPDANKGQSGRIAHGIIQPGGVYRLKTEKEDGASAGWYRVTVISLANTSTFPSQTFQFPQALIPEKYRDPELSMLTCEVKSRQSNSIDFNLD